MSHHHAPQPEKHGAGSKGHAPQVAVRDGNRLLCPCCGEVLMVLPEKPPSYGATRQTVAVDPEIAAYAFPADAPPPIPNRQPARLQPASLDQREPRERNDETRARERERYRLRRPPREPLTHEAARLFAWTFYRLKALNIQLIGEVTAKQEVIETLQREFDAVTREAPREERPRCMMQMQVILHREARKLIAARRRKRVCQAIARHAQVDVGMAPGDGCEADVVAAATGQGVVETNERGPP
ncbi:hypothetical protein [Bremerella sp. P1]|uniref:hypothetical protein n=1 Tax=Bremerella sp. P1 TaxID=3026424 RepID=UPI002368CA2B|nr:hypothetical protein [Bremerella sp. P1]WDI44325.1 hypothetical protein PSR63_10320 [Bremerella sp. P1]